MSLQVGDGDEKLHVRIDPESGTYEYPEGVGSDVEGKLDASPCSFGSRNGTWFTPPARCAWALNDCSLPGAWTCESPKIDRRYGSDIFDHDAVDALIADLRWSGSATLADKTFIAACWYLMQQNIDVIRWAACMLTGHAAAGHCIENVIRREYAKINLVRNPSDKYFDVCINASGTSTGTVAEMGRVGSLDICTGHPTYLSAQPFFAATFGWSGDLAVCPVLNYSGILVHEIAHRCWRRDKPFTPASEHTSKPEHCDFNYRLDALYVWALLQRYPRSTYVNCCKNGTSRNARLFNNTQGQIWRSSCGTVNMPVVIGSVTAPIEGLPL